MRAAYEVNGLKLFTATAALVVAATTPCTFAADPDGPLPTFTMMWDATGDIEDPFQYNPNDFKTSVTEFGTWALGGGDPGPKRTVTGWMYQGHLNNMSTMWDFDWTAVVNPDPIIDANINVSNTTASTQTYSVFMTLVLSGPVTPSTIMRGSVSSSITDGGDASGVTISATSSGGEFGTGEPIYQAYIDSAGPTDYGSVVRTMWDNGAPGYSLSAGPGGSNSDSDMFNNEPGPGANNSISILLKFTLSPGDSASVTAVFEIIPGPGGLAALAVFGLLVPRRRRS